MAEWKPTFYRTNGKPGATAPLRKLARKFLENMKHRNEELGNYANPVHRFQYDDIKFLLSSLPGYDIIHITVPYTPVEKEEEDTAEIYSGLWEPRFQASGLTGWYLRWQPSDYEVYNSETDTTPPGLGASVDGAAEELTNPLPPSRWLYNDYDATRTEAPWLADTGGEVTVARTHPGKYSGKLRELVQMQLGYKLLPEFTYRASESEGIHLEVLDEDTTRIWLVQISGTNGIVKQIMADYSITAFEREEGLETGAIPPEIEEMGWFTTQTSFDTTRPVYTKSAWDAVPEEERPDIKAVTFELLPAADYSSAVAGYSAYGNYGWSFHPDGASAVLVGLGWNSPSGGGIAVNYKSKLFTININHAAFTATVSDGGKNVFLMESANDHVKFPGPTGLLNSTYFWKAQNGLAGTQPSDLYTAPIYAYYNLIGERVVCEYTYDAGTYETQNGDNSQVLTWADTLACRSGTTWFPSANWHYANCDKAQSGVGTMRKKHGFVTTIAPATSYDTFNGWRATWSEPAVLCNGNDYVESHSLKISFGGPLWRYGAVHADTHYVALEEGDWSAVSSSVLIIPSFERLGFYHYQKLRTLLDNGRLTHPQNFIYERGQPVREHGNGSIGQDDCEYDNPCTDGFDGAIGHLRPDYFTTPEYWASRDGVGDTVQPIHIACSAYKAHDCFIDDGVLRNNPLPSDQYPYSTDTTVPSGGLMLPDGSSVVFSEDEILNQSEPFRESSSTFGYQSVISCFDTFSSKYIFSMPNIALTPRKHTANGFPDDFIKIGVLFSGMPYFIE